MITRNLIFVGTLSTCLLRSLHLSCCLLVEVYTSRRFSPMMVMYRHSFLTFGLTTPIYCFVLFVSITPRYIVRVRQGLSPGFRSVKHETSWNIASWYYIRPYIDYCNTLPKVNKVMDHDNKYVARWGRFEVPTKSSGILLCFVFALKLILS